MPMRNVGQIIAGPASYPRSNPKSHAMRRWYGLNSWDWEDNDLPSGYHQPAMTYDP